MSVYKETSERLEAIEKRASELTKGTFAKDLTVLQMEILALLYARDARKVSDIAKSVGRAPTSFTPILDKLEILGYIIRQAHPTDRRVANIVLMSRAKKPEVKDKVLEVLTKLEMEFAVHPIKSKM